MKIHTINGEIEVPEPPSGELKCFGKSLVLTGEFKIPRDDYYVTTDGRATFGQAFSPRWILVPVPKSREEQRRERLIKILNDFFNEARTDCELGKFIDQDILHNIEALYRELPVEEK